MPSGCMSGSRTPGRSRPWRESGVTQPAISRQVAALEQHLGARLIHRTTRSLTLTQDGHELRSHARRVLDCVEEAESSVGRRLAAPGGLVRLLAPASFGRLHVAPRIPRLLDRYPELSVQLRLVDGPADLVADGVDLAVRLGPVNGASTIARLLGTSPRHVIASADYLCRHGEPAHPSELSGHSCAVYLNIAAPNMWRFEGPDGPLAVPVNGRFRTDSSEAMREAVLGGACVALTPAWLFADELGSGQVRAVLPGFRTEPLAIHALYPSRRNLASRTRAVIEFLADEFRLDPVINSCLGS